MADKRSLGLLGFLLIGLTGAVLRIAVEALVMAGRKREARLRAEVQAIHVLEFLERSKARA